MVFTLALLVAAPQTVAAPGVPLAEPDGCRDASRFMEVQASLKADLQRAYDAAGRDAERAAPALDPIVARYDPCFNSFAEHQERLFEETVAAAPRRERATMRERARPWLASLRGDPQRFREQLERNGSLASPSPPMR